MLWVLEMLRELKKEGSWLLNQGVLKPDMVWLEVTDLEESDLSRVHVVCGMDRVWEAGNGRAEADVTICSRSRRLGI